MHAGRTAGTRRAVPRSMAILLLPGVAACTSSGDAAPAAQTGDSTAPAESAAVATPVDDPAPGLACSQVGTLLDIETPNDENWQTPDYYLVDEPVDDTVVVDAGVVCIVQSTIDGDLLVDIPGNTSFAALVPGGVVSGSVSVTGSARNMSMETDAEFYSVESDPDAGPPRVEGDVTCEECSAFALVAGEVEGSVVILNKPGSSLLVTDMTIGGDLTLTSSSGFGGEREGTTNEPPPVTGNTVGGSVALIDNYGRPLLLEANTISGDLACEGNIPEPEGRDNTVEGTASGQCSGL